MSGASSFATSECSKSNAEPRKARNPRTGDKVFVPEKFVVTFKPGKEMEQRVRELERQAAAAAKAALAAAAAIPKLAGTPSYDSDGSGDSA